MTVSAQVRAALGAVLVLLLAILAAAFYVPHELNERANELYVEDVIPLRSLVQDLVAQTATEQAAVRVYLATGDASALAQYRQRAVQVNRDFEQMEPHIARHPSIGRLVRRAVTQIGDIQGLLDLQIAARRTDFQEPPDPARVNEAFGELRATVDLMLDETDRFVEEAEADQRERYRQLLIVLGVLGGGALLIAATLFATTPRRLGQLYANEAQLRREAESRANAARALAHVTDGVVLADPNGRMRFWNEAAQSLLAFDPASASGRSFSEVAPALVRLTGPSSSPRAVLPIQRPHGQRWLDVTRVDFDEGAVYAIRDVTEERALERIRSDLVATVSHELRTPMTTIYGAARTLQRDDVEFGPDRQRELLDLIATESERLAKIVDDILFASRLEAGTVEIEPERCDPVEIATSVVDAARVRAPEIVRVTLDAPDPVPPVAADPDRLRQVLVNLVENAIKYSPGGGDVTVAIDSEDGIVQFAVHDEGIGFPREQNEQIFARFHRLDPHHTRGIQGTGLGLYISRELVERMGGRIWAESEPGSGSSFFVELPLAEPAQVAYGQPSSVG